MSHGRLFALVLSCLVLFVVNSRAQQTDITCLPDPVLHAVVATLPTPAAMSSFDCDPVPIPYPCAEAAAPTVENWNPSEPLIQELKITASPIDAMANYKSMSILAEWYDDSAGEWRELWTHETEDAVARAQAAGVEQAVFGATGLKPGRQHRFRVAWCKQSGSDRGCNCFAEDTYGFLDENPADGQPDAQPATPSEFPATPVSQPIVRQMEDRFHRPPTNPKRDRVTNAVLQGDGLGPDGLWHDDQGTTAQNGAHIIETGGEWMAEIPTNGELIYEPRLPDPHSYAEIEFQPHCSSARPNPPSNPGCSATATNYRVDVRTRSVIVAGTVYTYFAQALYEPDWNGPEGPVSEPTIRLFRGSGPVGSVTGVPLISNAKVANSPAFNPATGVGCVINGQNKSPDPTSPSSDLDGLTDGSRVLLRIEAEDAVDPEQVALKVFLAWDCSGGTCVDYCTWKADDSAVTPGHPLFATQNHQEGFLAHHWDIAVGAFRAGSEQ